MDLNARLLALQWPGSLSAQARAYARPVMELGICSAAGPELCQCQWQRLARHWADAMPVPAGDTASATASGSLRLPVRPQPAVRGFNLKHTASGTGRARAGCSGAST